MDKKKERKKKQRERVARARVMQRRQEIRDKDRETKKKDEAVALSRPRLKPIVNIQKSRKEVLANLEKNLKIIQAMRDNYLQDVENRKQVNETLEEQGHMTMREKLDAMVSQAHQDIKDAKDLWAADDIVQEMKQGLSNEFSTSSESSEKLPEEPKKKKRFGGSAEVKVFPRNS